MAELVKHKFEVFTVKSYSLQNNNFYTFLNSNRVSFDSHESLCNYLAKDNHSHFRIDFWSIHKILILVRVSSANKLCANKFD